MMRLTEWVLRTNVEGELAMVPGEEPGTAIRVRVDESETAAVVLEQLRHSATAGWYVQQSFRIPRSLLPALLPQLRKADCLLPRRSPPETGRPATPPMRICG